MIGAFDEYADAVRDEAREFHRDVAAGVVVHDRPFTREEAARDAELQRERNERLADLFDNDDPESLWYR